MGVRAVFNVVIVLVNKLMFFLFNVGMVSNKLRAVTNNGLRQAVGGIASGSLLNFFLNTKVAVTVRSSSTVGIVLINLMGSNVIRFAGAFNVVVNSGINAALAT